MNRILDKCLVSNKKKSKLEVSEKDLRVEQEHLENLKKEVKFEYALHMQKNIVLTQM